MAIQIINENTNIILTDLATNSKVACLDIFTFSFAEASTDAYILADAKEKVSITLATVVDDNGDTFTDSAALVTYLELLSRETPNLGASLFLDNMELTNTGSHVKMLNRNTGEQAFMVQQRVDNILGTTSVYYTEQSSARVDETSADAYQGLTTHTGKGVINAQSRYALPIDITVIQDTFIYAYRSSLNTDIENLNIKIFSVTQSPVDASLYRELTFSGI